MAASVCFIYGEEVEGCDGGVAGRVGEGRGETKLNSSNAAQGRRGGMTRVRPAVTGVGNAAKRRWGLGGARNAAQSRWEG